MWIVQMTCFVVKSAIIVGSGTVTLHLAKNITSTKPIKIPRIMGQVGQRKGGMLNKEMVTNARVAAFHQKNTTKNMALISMCITSNRGTNLMNTKSGTGLVI
jgi:hypothetical protein